MTVMKIISIEITRIVQIGTKKMLGTSGKGKKIFKKAIYAD